MSEYDDGLCPNCDCGCQVIKLCVGCDTWLCSNCYQEHNQDAPDGSRWPEHEGETEEQFLARAPWIEKALAS